LLHRSSPPLALSTPCPCTHYTHGLSTTSPSFTFTPVFHTARHVHWYGPSRHQLASLTHTTLLVPHGLTPQPSSPRNTTTLSVHTDHRRSRHNPHLTGAHNTPACSSQASPSNDLLLTDLYSNELAQQGLLLTSAPVQLSAPHRPLQQRIGATRLAPHKRTRTTVCSSQTVRATRLVPHKRTNIHT
jgi:hypothetical protein